MTGADTSSMALATGYRIDDDNSRTCAALRRRGSQKRVGAGLLWVGFGFNAGAALSANPGRYRHRLGTSCGIAGALTSIAMDWWGLRPSVLGRVSGAVAGAPITPVSGFGLPWHGVVIGTAAGALCVYRGRTVKTHRHGFTGRGSRRIDAVAGLPQEEREELDSWRSLQ